MMVMFVELAARPGIDTAVFAATLWWVILSLVSALL